MLVFTRGSPQHPAQVEAAYSAFKAKYFSVTLQAIRSELTSNTAFSEVLALEPWPERTRAP